MNCERSEELLAESVFGPISAEDRRALNEHLAGCASCRKLAASFNEIAAGVAIDRAKVPPPEIRQSILNQIKIVSIPMRRRVNRPMTWGLLLAACLVVAVLYPRDRATLDVISGPPVTLAMNEEFVASEDIVVAARPSGEVISLRGGSRAKVMKEGAMMRLSLMSGSALSSVPKGNPFEVATNIVVAGVRGTVFFVDAHEDSIYVCICRGAIELAPASGPARHPLESQTHKAVYVTPDGTLVPNAPLIGHSDSDVIRLQSF